jgi:periplasmic divalent cation tolerance protein
MNTLMVYITAKDSDEARRIGKLLVQSRLAACVNIFDQMHSFYEWNGELQEDHEAVIIAKTIEAKVPAMIEAVRRSHSYQIPCILALPVKDGNPDFIDWIAQQVKVVPRDEGT